MIHWEASILLLLLSATFAFLIIPCWVIYYEKEKVLCMCRTNSFLKEGEVRWIREFIYYEQRAIGGSQFRITLVPNTLKSWDLSPRLMATTIHMKIWVLFLGSVQLSLRQKKATLCYSDRPKPLSVMELLCSAERDLKGHVCFERASAHSIHDTAAALYPTGLPLSG